MCRFPYACHCYCTVAISTVIQRSPKQKVESLKIMAFFKQTFLQTKISIISSKVMKWKFICKIRIRCKNMKCQDCFDPIIYRNRTTFNLLIFKMFCKVWNEGNIRNNNLEHKFLETLFQSSVYYRLYNRPPDPSSFATRDRAAACKTWYYHKKSPCK